MTTDLELTFGERVLVLRRRAGLTAEELGNMIGRSSRQIRSYESDTSTTSPAGVAMLAKALGVPSSVLTS